MSTFTRPGARALAAASLALLFAGGCATAPVDSVRSPASSVTDAVAGTGELDALGSAAVGAAVALPPGNPLGSRRVRVIDDYRAASGRRCRHVAGANDENAAVVCRRADGHWSVTRGLVDDTAAR